MVPGIHNPMIVADQFRSAVSADLTEQIIGIGDSATHICLGDDHGTADRNFKTLEILNYGFAPACIWFASCRERRPMAALDAVMLTITEMINSRLTAHKAGMVPDANS